jgi:hypothetical protein
VDDIYRKKASDIISIFREKADKIDEIDRFNIHMRGIKH